MHDDHAAQLAEVASQNTVGTGPLQRAAAACASVLTALLLHQEQDILHNISRHEPAVQLPFNQHGSQCAKPHSLLVSGDPVQTARTRSGGRTASQALPSHDYLTTCSDDTLASDTRTVHSANHVWGPADAIMIAISPWNADTLHENTCPCNHHDRQQSPAVGILCHADGILAP
jgi:hypothetical protein